MIIGFPQGMIRRTDAYKGTHWRQYPVNTRTIWSYLESRGGLFPHTLFFGLQYYLQQYLHGSVVDLGEVQEASEFYRGVFGADYFNEAGWRRIVDVHGGRIPVRIRAVKEGTVVPVSNILMSVENTDPELPWITNFIESMLLKVWYPTTVATVSFFTKVLIDRHARRTGARVNDFHLNDFGYRGVSSEESAELGGGRPPGQLQGHRHAAGHPDGSATL